MLEISYLSEFIQFAFLIINDPIFIHYIKGLKLLAKYLLDSRFTYLCDKLVRLPLVKISYRLKEAKFF